MKVMRRRENLLSTVTTLAYVALSPFSAKAESAVVTPVSMAGIADKTGAAERIEIADFMVMLSQEAASAACHLHNGISPEESRQLLQEAHDDFALYLHGLIYGDETLKIANKEEDRVTLARLIEVSDLWDPISEAIERVLKDPNDKQALNLIKAQNVPLHDASVLLLSEVIGVYSNPIELLQADALLIQFSGRQATLTQKMAKESCKIWTGNRSEALIAEFEKTIGLYDATLNALLNGMPAVGIKAAPTPEIRAALTAEAERWQIVKATMLTVRDYAEISDETKAKAFHQLNEAMHSAKKIADLYVTYSHHEYN